MSIERPFDDPKWETLKILRSIGKGWYGEVFMGRINKSFYVLKISKVMPEMFDGEDSTKGAAWRELYFYTKIAPKYKKILKIYTIDYKIGKCDFKHPMTEDHKHHHYLPSKYKQKHQDLVNSPYCLMNVQPYFISLSLSNHFWAIWNRILPKDELAPPISKFKWLDVGESTDVRIVITKKLYYKWFIEIMKQLQCLHSIGFSHNDIHGGNIIITIKDKTAILIDYGFVNCNKWNNYTTDIDIAYLFNLTHLSTTYDEVKRLNQIYGDNEFPTDNYFQCKDMIMSSMAFNPVHRACENVPEEQKYDVEFEMAKMMMPELVNNIIFKKYVDQMVWDKMWLIDYKDVLYYIKYAFNNLEQVITYFEKRYLHIV